MPDASLLEPLGSLVGMVIIVWFFLKHITKSDQAHVESLKEISITNREESKQRQERVMHHLDKNTEVIGGNSKVLGETTAVLGQATDVLRRVDDWKRKQ